MSPDLHPSFDVAIETAGIHASRGGRRGAAGVDGCFLEER
jgi:hypothetical protein